MLSVSRKEAAGVITMPFYPLSLTDHNHPSKQETAVVHIFPPCQFSQKILKLICPSIEFPSSTSVRHSPTGVLNNEHLMVIIVHND